MRIKGEGKKTRGRRKEGRNKAPGNEETVEVNRSKKGSRTEKS